jgi:hypothetical protein
MAKLGITPVQRVGEYFRILIISLFFSMDYSYVLQEIKKRPSLRRFTHISEVPTPGQFYRFLNRFVEKSFMVLTIAAPEYLLHETKFQNKVDAQSDDYNQKKTLDFDICTINLGQIWEATYTLQVLTNGTINVFGPESDITFTTLEKSTQQPPLVKRHLHSKWVFCIH